MDLEFYNLTAESEPIIDRYSDLRTLNTCEAQFINQFIWSDFYNTRYCVTDDYIFFVLDIEGNPSSFMPLCNVQNIEKAFKSMEMYFNQNLNTNLKIYLADKNFLNELKKIDKFESNYRYDECRDYFDYVYDAEKLKTLSGKKYHKKKNHLNSFLKQYDGRFEYKNLNCSSRDDIRSFFERWKADKLNNDILNRLDDEARGIDKLLNDCEKLNAKIGGVYIDGELEAFTIGSYNPKIQRAFIHIEKANDQIRGLYNFINQQFLINSFPYAKTVNREDDMGIEGLRHAKMSYNPIELIEKYNIFQK